MTTEEWNQVWRLFQQARDLPAGARRELLAGVEPHIAEEIEAMLEDDAPEPEPPAPGRAYGRYTLIASLGSGGMGEVFKARDSELGRLVAIKFVGAKARLLPAARERLIREAQSASALNHPNLVTVHDVIRFDGGAALITELVQGQSLRAFCGVARPIPRVAAWGAQIARALAAAHAEAIVHSDIKPENIMLRDDGYIKIVDFGLAQHTGAAGGLKGFPLGTIGYMSPEQTRAEQLTGSSDVFSLGVTLIELATGKHPFLDETPSATARNIEQRPVDYPAPALPSGKAFGALLHTMLEKDPSRRPSMAEVVGRLERIASSGANAFRRKLWRAGATVLAAGAILWFRINRPAPVLRFAPPVAITRYSGVEQQPSFSPDGSRIAFVWSGPDDRQDDIYIRATAGADEPPRRLTDDPNQNFSPVWSPDGKAIAWYRRSLAGGDGELWVAPVNGMDAGPARLAANVADHGGFYGLAWSPDSAFLICRDKGPAGYPLVQVNVADGSKLFLTSEPDAQDYQPVLSPDRRRLLFFRYNISKPQVCTMEFGAAPSKPACREIKTGLGSATWSLDSRSILLHTQDALWLLDPVNPLKQPVRLLEGVFSHLTTDAAGARYAFSRTIVDSNIWRFDIASRQLSQLISSSEEDSEPQFSPDGSKILFRSNRKGPFELYVCNNDGNGLRQLTRLSGHCGSARWSPDGQWIAYDSTQQFPGPAGVTKFDNIFVMPSAGGPARRLTDDKDGCVVPNWSADSRWVYYTRGKDRKPWKSPMEGGAAMKVSDREMWGAVESADGRWILYEQPTTGKGIWRRAIAAGTDERVPETERLTYRTWEVRGDSLVFLRSGREPGFFRLSFRPGAHRAEELVGPAPKRLLLGPATMSYSPDGKTILYTSLDLTIGDIYALNPEPRP